MALTVKAVYENGVLRPAEPLPLKEHDKVQTTVHTEPSPLVQAYGLLGWTGDAETVRRVALDPEFDVLEGS